MELLPQEIEVWYILPAIRKEFTKALIEVGFKQKSVAKILGITEAAVSQYKYSKRASQVKLSQSMIDRISEMSKKIKNSCNPEKIKTTDDMKCRHCNGLYDEIQILLKMAREEELICKLHKELTPVHNNCKICLSLNKEV